MITGAFPLTAIFYYKPQQNAIPYGSNYDKLSKENIVRLSMKGVIIL